MPFKSQAQRRKFAELLVEGKITPETFEEWNRETRRPQAAGASEYCCEAKARDREKERSWANRSAIAQDEKA